MINESRNGSLYAVNVMGPDGYISRTQGGTTSYYMKNAHGDIVRAVTESAAKTFSATYNAWGEVMDSDNGSGNPIGYAGEFHDEESGMIYLRGRYYDPEIRRFITEDPAKDGWNWYAYCGNNPVMFVDPTGLWGELVHVEATKWIFEEMGLSSYHAEIVAEANISVDKGDMSAINLDNVAQSRHFDRNPDPNVDSREVWADACLSDAIRTWNEADEMYYNGEITFEQRHKKRVIALESLGRGLHSLQDIDAHMDMKTDDFDHVIKTWHLFKGDPFWAYSNVDNPRYDAQPTRNTGEYTKIDSGSDFGSQRYSNTVLRTKQYLSKFYSNINVSQ